MTLFLCEDRRLSDRLRPIHSNLQKFASMGNNASILKKQVSLPNSITIGNNYRERMQLKGFRQLSNRNRNDVRCWQILLQKSVETDRKQ
jgi:hypothetical protein